MNHTIQPGTLYLQEYTANKPSKLYSLDLDTGKATLIGDLTTEVYDLVFVDQSFYGLDKKDFGFRKTMKLIKIDPTTGQTAVVGDTWFDVVGMDYNPVDKKLYATAHRNHQIIEIDISSGHGKSVVNLSDRKRLCGEIAFDSTGQAFISLLDDALKKYLATVDLTTGQVKMIGDIGFPGLASMKFIGSTLYGVTGQYEGLDGSRNGQVIRIDTVTGEGILVTTTDPLVTWAGMAVYAPISSSVMPPTPDLIPPTPNKPQPEYDKPSINQGPDDAQPAGPPVVQPHPTPDVPVVINNLDQLTFDQFDRNPATDIICVAPIRTMIRREEEIVLIRRVRKVEEIDASLTCPTGTTSV